LTAVDVDDEEKKCQKYQISVFEEKKGNLVKN